MKYVKIKNVNEYLLKIDGMLAVIYKDIIIIN
jgi:hypothetical protein